MDLTTRLLIVDDDPGIRELTADFLTGHGYVVDTASDAATMRAAMAAAEYDLVVLDVMMPGEDGLTILRGLDPATVTDANCQVTSTTIFPAAYSGRWPHMHFEVFSSLATALGGKYPILPSQRRITCSATIRRRS